MIRSTIAPVATVRSALVSNVLSGALGVAIVLGAAVAPTARAQMNHAPRPAAALQARRSAAQTRPQKEIPFDPADFDKYVGYYELSPSAFFHVFRRDDHYFAQLTGQPPVEWYPESPTKFFATVVAAQISFRTDSRGAVTALILHQNGFRQSARRVTRRVASRAAADLRRRIRQNRASAGTATAIRRQIESYERTGQPLYAELTAPLAAAAHRQAANSTALFRSMGAFRSLRFYRVLPSGVDDYLATFANGKLEVLIGPLGPDGKIGTLFFHPVP